MSGYWSEPDVPVDEAQLKKWAQYLRLRPYKFGKSVLSWRYFRGYGRHWRVNARGEFQASVPSTMFDKWANSTYITISIPTTRQQLADFVFAVANRPGKIRNRNTKKCN